MNTNRPDTRRDRWRHSSHWKVTWENKPMEIKEGDNTHDGYPTKNSDVVFL